MAAEHAVARWPGILLALAALAGACAPPQAASGPVPDALSAVDLLRGGDATGFAQAIEPYAFRFPADHGPHPGFRTEWWYWTGNLSDDGGGAYGYQLTLFRNALTPHPAERLSAWGAGAIYLAHLAVADGAGRFHSAERFVREALGLAGAEGEPLRVWAEDWRATETAAGGFRLAAADDGFGIELDLAASRPPVLQGDGGLSRKGPAAGEASYYYSLTRLETTGRLRIGDREVEVSGTSWMDREWSTAPLPAGLAGWDWFALQLDDGRDLMFYRLRRAGGGADRFSAGMLLGPGGDLTRLAVGDVELVETASWVSPVTGVRYPAGWSMQVPSAGLRLEIRPLIADQELRHRLRYWEGAVTVRAAAGGSPASGSGYVELVGYGDPGA